MQFSKKEKILVILLLALVFLLGGYKLLVSPALDDLTTALATLEETTKKEQNVLTNIAKKDETIALNGSYAVMATEKSKLLFPNLESDRVQMFFNDIAKVSEVDYTSMSFSTKEYTEIPDFTGTYTTGDYAAKEYANKIRENDGEEKVDEYIEPEPAEGDPVEKQNTKLFEKVETTVQFSAPYETIIKYLENLKNSERYVCVSSMVMDSAEGSIVNVTAVFDCYGTVKISDYDSLINRSIAGETGKDNLFK